MIERIIPTPHPTLGVVVGTYGAVPYIHLHLESWRRNYGNIPLLVHDDGSPEGDDLRALCTLYGADFSRNDDSFGHFAGDLTVYSHGLRWAQERSLDLLVKFSRRFIPRLNWIMELQTLAYVTQYATFSSLCEYYNFGFRTECLGMHVPSWLAVCERIQENAEEVKGADCHVEALMHHHARFVHRSNCLANKLYETVHPTPDNADAYAPWRLLGTSRHKRLPHVLWHNCYAPFEYYMEAVSCGILDYDAHRFETIHV